MAKELDFETLKRHIKEGRKDPQQSKPAPAKQEGSIISGLASAHSKPKRTDKAPQRVLPSDDSYQAFEFRGNPKEFFRIWIVNIALSLLTLGAYSAWAKVRTNRYLYANTHLNNSGFEFNADPRKIFYGRLVVASFYGLFLLFVDVLGMIEVAIGIAVLFLILLPWLMRQAISFRLKSASYRNVPFKFTAKTAAFYRLVALPVSILILLTVLGTYSFDSLDPVTVAISIVVFAIASFVFVPVLYQTYKALVINHAHYGTTPFAFHGGKREAFNLFLKIFLWSTLASALLGAVVTFGTTTLTTTVKTLGISHPLITYGLPFVVMILYLVFAGFYKGVSDGYLSNFIRNNTTLEHSSFKSTISPVKLGLISASNALAIIMSLGLLYPWTKLRYLRYKIENTHFSCDDYDQFTSEGYEQQSTLGEETMDFFDIDIGL